MGLSSSNPGLFITFEGTEGCGKSTQIQRLRKRLAAQGLKPQVLREPGGTDIGEEIRHTLQHSERNHAMTPAAELLLFNASRAQLVDQVIRPALAAGEVILCDRFYDSTVAYQAYGRGLDLAMVQNVIDFAVGDVRPHLTIWLKIPLELSVKRRQNRPGGQVRDRMEEADHDFFQRVEEGFTEIARLNPKRVKIVDGSQSLDDVETAIWAEVSSCLASDKM